MLDGLERDRQVKPRTRDSAALAVGGLAAVAASACCLGPLILISIGVSGAWISNLTALDPYRPWFIAIALVALFLAWKPIFRPPQACSPGDVCAIPQVRTTYKILFWMVLTLVLLAIGFPYVIPYVY